MKVSCVMCTYRRLKYAERAVNFFLDQDYEGETELIIYNTDAEYPVSMVDKPGNVIIVNNGTDRLTDLDYTNIGAVRRDALAYATGDCHVTFDDDDWYAPWFIRQGVDGLIRTGRQAWKPIKSLSKYNSEMGMHQNVLEASVIVRKAELDFNMTTGSEGLKWYTRLRDQGELDENETKSIPAYAFDWSDPFQIHPHRQSGAIDRPNNFEEHKLCSQDIHIRSIRRIDVSYFNRDYYEYLKEHKNELDQECFETYAAPYISIFTDR
jgi:glycosyltransferase involved in cell wall biosynthesis